MEEEEGEEKEEEEEEGEEEEKEEDEAVRGARRGWRVDGKKKKKTESITDGLEIRSKKK